MDVTWDDILDDFAYTVSGLEDRQFLVVEFLTEMNPRPYAQVAPEPDGSWYCEVVSTHHLPEHIWPIDELALMAAGWDPPVGRRTNWSLSADSGEEAACSLIQALRFGRLCLDPDNFRGRIDRWPPPPDNTAPEPMRPREPFSVTA